MSEFMTREGELSALAFLIQKPIFFTQKKSRLKHLKFTSNKVNLIVDSLRDSYEKYGQVPTQSELLEATKQTLMDRSTFDILSWPEYQDIITTSYSMEVTGNTGERINLFLANVLRKELAEKLATAPLEDLSKAAAEIEAELKSLRRTVYQEHDFGTDFFQAAREGSVVHLISQYRSDLIIPGPWPEFDSHLMGGGSRRGEVNCFVGTTNIGKTTMLLNMSRGFVMNGKRVLHIYLDSTVEEINVRFASCMTQSELGFGDYDEDMIRKAVSEAASMVPEGRFWLKQFPARSIDVEALAEYLDGFFLYLLNRDLEDPSIPPEQKGKIDVLVLDYFELVSYDGNESDFVVDEAKAQFLNGLAIKHMFCLWTACQGGTEAMKSDKPKLYQAHGYKNKFHPMANVFMLCCAEDQKQSLSRHFTIDKAKSRRASPGVSLPMLMECSKQYVRVHGDFAITTNSGVEKSGTQIATAVKEPDSAAAGLAVLGITPGVREHQAATAAVAAQSEEVAFDPETGEVL